MSQIKFKIALWLIVCSGFLPVQTWSQVSIDSLRQLAYDRHAEGLKAIGLPAVEKYNEALQIRKYIHQDLCSNHEEVLEGIIKGYFNIGIEWFYLEDMDKAKAYFDSCLLAQQEFAAGDLFFSHRRRGLLYQGLGKMYKEESGFQQSLDAFHNAYIYFSLDDKTAPQRVAFNRAQMLNDISALYIKWEMEADSILHYAQRAKTIYQNLLLEGYEKGGQVVGELRKTIINESFGYMMNHQLDEAELSLQEAINLLEEYDDLIALTTTMLDSNQPKKEVKDYSELVKDVNGIYNSLTITRLKAGDYDAVQSILSKSIQLNQWLVRQEPTLVDPMIMLSGNHQNLGELHFGQQEYGKALADNNQALQFVVHELANNQDENGNPDLQQEDLLILSDLYFLKAILGKTKSLQMLDRQAEALATADLGINYIYAIRREYVDTKSRFQLASIMKELIEHTIDMYLDRAEPDVEKALYYAEKSKIYTLLEAVNDVDDLRVAGVDIDLLTQEKNLRIEIDQTKDKILKTKSQDEKASLREQLGQQKRKLDGWIDSLYKSENYQKLFVGIEPLDRRSIQRKLLAKDQALIEYFVGKDATTIFLVPKRGPVQSFQIPINEMDLSHQIRDVLNGILYSYNDQPEALPNYQKQWTKEGLEQQFFIQSRQLFDTYFAPILEASSANRFVIIPDGAFNRLPFSVLLQEAPGVTPGHYRDYPYLGMDYGLSYCYAATLLGEMQKPLSGKADNVLSFAPSFSGNQSTTHGALPGLRHNTEEAQKVCELLESRLPAYTDSDAGKRSFVNLIEKEAYYVVHLATHGKADYADPQNSFISFSQTDSTKVDLDQLFYLRELYNLDIDVELVVLSSCESNLGPVHRAGGMLSLTRGFAFAGAKSVVSSLWAVNERATTELMSLFYEKLKLGMSKDLALQEAKQTLRKNGNYRHPYYWAAFIPVGKVQEQTPGLPKSLYLGLGALLGLVAMYRWKDRLSSLLS